jgi:hypothetical protein
MHWQMVRLMAYLALLVGLVCTSPLRTQPQSVSRIDEIRRLSRRLHWANARESQDYERNKAVVTQRLLKELDAFVNESFRRDGATAELMMQRLDSALGYKNGDTRHNVAFVAALPTGRFLVAGIEVARGGPAIPEDAVSFQAYRADESRLTLVADSGVWEYGTDLYAKQLVSAPVKGEFWFLSSAIQTPSLAPPMVAIRLYAFDGAKFTVVWVPPDSRAQVCRNCVQATRPRDSFTVVADGFVVNKLFDPTGRAPGSPGIVIHDEFVTTIDGPKKGKSWQTELR